MTPLAAKRIANLRATLEATTRRGVAVYAAMGDASDALWRPLPLDEWAARRTRLASLEREWRRLERIHDRTRESLRRAGGCGVSAPTRSAHLARDSGRISDHAV